MKWKFYLAKKECRNRTTEVRETLMNMYMFVISFTRRSFRDCQVTGMASAHTGLGAGDIKMKEAWSLMKAVHNQWAKTQISQ